VGLGGVVDDDTCGGAKKPMGGCGFPPRLFKPPAALISWPLSSSNRGRPFLGNVYGVSNDFCWRIWFVRVTSGVAIGPLAADLSCFGFGTFRAVRGDISSEERAASGAFLGTLCDGMRLPTQPGGTEGAGDALMASPLVRESWRCSTSFAGLEPRAGVEGG
jgi:hypothetical protein